MKKNIRKYLIISLLLFTLVLIRIYESTVFNDGLIIFFKHKYLSAPLPNVSAFSILIIDTLRFWLNTALSMIILYVLFGQKNLIRFLLWFYFSIFIISILLFMYSLMNYEVGHYLALFYTRRILIQPLALLILIPALFYQKKELIQKE